MSFYLKDGVEPWSDWGSKEQFEALFTEDNRYYNIPRKYFRYENGTVYLDARIASQVRWHIDGELPTQYNIACSGGHATVDDEKISINPGFWCSYIHKDDIIDDN